MKPVPGTTVNSPAAVGLLRRLRRNAAPAAKRLLFGVGALNAVRRVRPSQGLAILRYHAVCGPEGQVYAEPAICVTPGAFERQVAYLASHYRILPLPEAVACLRAGRTLPSNAVAITFDDGYADNLAAARVLQRYGVSGTFYITAGCLKGDRPFWPSEIRQLVSRVTTPAIELEAPGGRLSIPCATDGDRGAAMRTLAKLFKSHTIPVRERLRDQLRAVAGGGGTTSFMLSWDELREIHRLGMTVGAHTVTHPNLPNAGLDDARAEIAGSKARLESELGAGVTMFSYPNGGAERYMTPEVAALVREAGFEAATTSWNGFAGANSDLFALERVQVAERLEDLAFALEIERFAFKPDGRAPQVDGSGPR
jgi:peptidoglycan/xylan/chitin deacetylase (PgdA/CDA1 family)